MLLLLFGNCSCGSGCKVAGDNEIVDHESAPFSLAEANAVLWAASPENNEEYAAAALVITTGDIDCGVFDDIDLGGSSFEELDDTLLAASGLVFVLDQRSYDPDNAPLSGWTGLWMGEAVSADQVRFMGAIAFDQGMVFNTSSYYSSDTWLDVAVADEDAIEGSFATTHWSGTYSATRCGFWAESEDEPEDSGWDSGW